MSVLLSASDLSDRLFIPVRAAVAVNAALSRYLPCGIKWPNDIVTDGKKLCGILAEASGNHVILGIGVNVNTPPRFFEEHHLPYATSLFAQIGKELPVREVLDGILFQLAAEADRCKVIELYRGNCVTLGKEIRVLQGDTEYYAVAEAITENGELLVRKADGTAVAVNSGEVSVRGSAYL
jgi:BirA family biotin operon repressor/biotin-[acetyl-CoA-carboxylase] ligase